MSGLALGDVDSAKILLNSMPLDWHGGSSVLEMHESRYPRVQRNWYESYFKYIGRRLLNSQFIDSSSQYEDVTYDVKRSIGWRLVAKTTQTDFPHISLDQVTPVRRSLEEFGCYGVMLALCNVEYGEFSQASYPWIELLYQSDQFMGTTPAKQTSISRYIVTRVHLAQILFLEITIQNLPYLNEIAENDISGRDLQLQKYAVDLDNLEPFLLEHILMSQ